MLSNNVELTDDVMPLLSQAVKLSSVEHVDLKETSITDKNFLRS